MKTKQEQAREWADRRRSNGHADVIAAISWVDALADALDEQQRSYNLIVSDCTKQQQQIERLRGEVEQDARDIEGLAGSADKANAWETLNMVIEHAQRILRTIRGEEEQHG